MTASTSAACCSVAAAQDMVTDELSQIRDYFAKKVEFYGITTKQIKEEQSALNNRPRKRHHFLPPTQFKTTKFQTI
jgi:IS30 family transposase